MSRTIHHNPRHLLRVASAALRRLRHGFGHGGVGVIGIIIISTSRLLMGRIDLTRADPDEPTATAPETISSAASEAESSGLGAKRGIVSRQA